MDLQAAAGAQVKDLLTKSGCSIVATAGGFSLSMSDIEHWGRVLSVWSVVALNITLLVLAIAKHLKRKRP